jgi:outer membrane biosynthesis protein TonB
MERLTDVAEDLNTTMKLSPPIDIEVESAKVLKNAIKREMESEGGQLYDTDKQTLKDETWEYLTETLEIVPRTQEAAAPPPDKPKKSEKVQKKKEEKKVAKKNAATKKKAPAKKKAEKKAAPAKKKAAPKNTSVGPSNKEKVYKLWKNGKGMKDPEKIVTKIGDAVKVTTVSGWLKAWANGKNLPACAKK